MWCVCVCGGGVGARGGEASQIFVRDLSLKPLKYDPYYNS